MNPEAMRIHSRGRFQGGIQVKNEKTRLSLNSLKPRPEKAKYKPFWGKIFYLDLPSVTISEKLQKDIKDLGGRVEEFLSKDISYLISSKKEAKYAQTLGQISPVPSPESAYTAETTSPHPSHDGSSFKSPDTVYLSRGKLLVEKAIKDHDFIPSNSILSNALSWGVKILHIDDIRYYIEQRKKELSSLKKSGPSERDVGKRVVTGTQKTRRGRLKKPFIKVEDMNQLYRPFYLQFTNIPFINYSTQKPCSPFDVDKPSSIQKQTQVKLRIQMEGHKCGGSSVQLHLKEKKKKGYCECCLQKYEDLETHLLSEQHRSFAQSNQYQVVDDILSKLDFGFVEYERDIPKQKRVKYSIRSFASVSTNFLEKTEPKEKCELEYICHKDAIGNNEKVMKQNIPLGETQEPEQKLVFLSESFPCLSNELRGFKDKRINECSVLNGTENDIKQNFKQLPPYKNKQDCIFNTSEHKLIANENDLQDHCPTRLHSYVQVSHFNTDNSVFQPKRKSNVHLFPSKDLKEKDLHSTNRPDCDLSAVNTSQEHLRIKTKSPCCSPGEPSACDNNSTDDLPSGRIHRKVRIVLERNKKENLQPNAELDEKTDFLTVQEAKRICTSPVQSLLDLFQTSGEKSEFYGFTSYTENSGICEMLDIWEEESSDTLLTTFFSSPSTSTFIGF
ncbi:protein DBF4 homolog A [Perognathus longimembris pacificus]|uniref:protein DBF4 homolog A n=1 Tax=Perognathus longimembris pacificus TaxID=214514 RepID=UPI0020195AAC|nr:protein DBF4 homolog A [Perognathus longimembris pacificus]